MFKDTVTLKQDVKHMCKRQKSDVCLLEMPPLLLSRTRKISDFRNVHCPQTNDRTVSTRRCDKKISLGAVSSEICIRKPLFSASQVKRPSSGCKLRNVGEHIEERIDFTKKANRLDVSKEIKGSIQREPRPYAQMIASYSDTMYGSCSSEILRDSLSSVMINGIHRSPFSTASLVSLKWSNKRKETRNTNISDVGLNAFSQDAKFSNASCATGFHFRYDDRNRDIAARHSNELHKSLSYASMIEKYSNAMNLGVDNYGGTRISKRNMSMKFNQVPMVVMRDEDANKKPSLIASNNASENVSGSQSLTEVEKNEAKTRERNNWLMKMDEIIKDLQRITEKADSSSKWMLQSVQERAYWLDRVMIAHKKKIKDRKEMLEKVSVDTTATELANFDAIPNTTVQDNESVSKDETQSTVQASWNHGPLKPPGSKPPGSKPPSSKPPASKPPASKPPATRSSSQTITTDKPSTSTIDYMKREPVNTSRITPTNSAKEPQIELRMTPSQNESVVSINVDETATKTAGSNKEQLSVVISSKRNRTDKIETSNTNVRADFGSMQISISENTIPVKQIEFSINGKPVSELKSIVARADKLDVVSSVDKVEIRIPSKGQNVAAAEHSRNIATSTSSKPVLNLQIAAKFNEPRFQQPRNAEMKTDPPRMSPPTSPVTPTPPTPPAPPVKPHRPQNFFSQDIPKSGITTSKAKEGDLATKGEPTMKTTYMDVSDVTDVKTSENVASHNAENTFSESDIHASTRKEETIPNTMDGVSSNADPNKTIFQSSTNVPSNPNVPSNDRTQQPTMNEEDGISKNRTPSNVIPWWSSEDSFKKIRKKGNTPKNVSKYDRTSAVTAMGRNAKATARKEDKSSTNVLPTQQRNSIESAKPDPQNVDNQRDIVTRKAMTKQTNEPDPMINYVRVKNLPRWVPIKRTPEVKTRPNNTGRVVKKARYRVKPTIHSRKSAKKEFDAPIVPTVRCSPKIVKYDTEFPQSVNVEKKRETKASKWKTDPKYVKPVVIERVDSQIGRANVQGSNTVYKKEELGGSANKSADVSVKEEKRSGTDGTGGKNLSTKGTNEDLRIKEILKSMKPIEKKKDGTLIDYGVIIPSRSPSRNVRQIPRILNKTSVNIISKETMQNQEKIVEPEKISSTKKKTLMEPKNLVEQSKIVEPEKISSVKKEANDTANAEIKYAANKTGKSELKFQDEKTKKEKKFLFDVKKDDLNARKDATSTIKEFKTSISNINQAENAFNRNKQSQQPISSVSEKSPSKETVSNRSFETPAEKANDTKSSLLDRPKNVFPGSSVTSGETQASEKKESKDTLKSVEQKKVPLEGTTAAPSKISDKTTNKVDTPPLMGTINFPGSQKSSAKTVKSDIAPLREAAADLKKEIEKNTDGTGSAPLKGTIHLQSLSNQDNLLKLANTDKEKVNSELTNQKDKFVKLNVTKKPSNGGGGNTGSSSPTTILTGPAGLSMQSEDTPIALKQKQDQNADIEIKDNGNSTNQKPGSTYMLFVDRPEKNILYSSWLQRFRNNFDDDKTV